MAITLIASNATSTDAKPIAAEIIPAPIYWYLVLFLSSGNEPTANPVCSPSSFNSVPNPGLLKERLGASNVYLLFSSPPKGCLTKSGSFICEDFFIFFLLINSLALLSLKGKLGKSILSGVP